MPLRYPILLLSFLALYAPAGSARAAVILQSAELTTRHVLVPIGAPEEVTDTAGPFPNDASRFAGVESGVLRVSVDQLFGSSSFILRLSDNILSITDNSGFGVVFDVDEPSPFTYHRGSPAPAPGWVILRAVGGTGAPVLPSQPGDFTGVLAPGQYTFTANTGVPRLEGPQRTTVTSTIRDVRLTVAPEPAALAPLAPAALVLCLCRRRRPA
jgi:hypothetical protein